MRKFTSTMISGLAVVVLVTGLVGCRSATSQLAGVPGFGWLDRSDNGWASYEPSPELPKPSATAEPTSGGAASKIASSDEPKSPFSKPVDGKPVEELAASDSKAGNSRFDGRYLPSDSPSKADGAESKPTFGSYASAYGKYTPPKLNKGGKDVAAQDGPYSNAKQTDVASSNGPKFGGAIDSPKFDSPKSDGPKFDASNVSGPKFDAALASKDVSAQPQSTAKAPSFGPALNEQGTTGKQPEFVADSSSRFGAGATKSYTPPGFPTTPETKSTTDRFSGSNNRLGTTTSRFDGAPQPAMDQAASQYNRFAEGANRAAATATNRFSNAVDSATQAISPDAQQPTDRFSNRVADAASTAASNRFENTVSAAQRALGDASQTARTTAQNTYNNAAAGLQNMASGYQQAASNAAANAASDISNRFQQATSSNMQSITAAAEQAKRQVANTAQSYTQGLTNRFSAGSTGGRQYQCGTWCPRVADWGRAKYGPEPNTRRSVASAKLRR